MMDTCFGIQVEKPQLLPVIGVGLQVEIFKIQ